MNCAIVLALVMKLVSSTWICLLVSSPNVTTNYTGVVTTYGRSLLTC